MKGDITRFSNPDISFSGDSTAPDPIAKWSGTFFFSKRLLDILSAVIGLVTAVVVALILLVLNPFFNPGPLLFKQKRMGLWGRPFTLWKFRTMTGDPSGAERGPVAPLEEDRITALGRFLRRSRIDELPNFFSVLIGEMSLVGPRPDLWSHALWFRDNIPWYAQRIRVRPGITGLAQIRGGYADQIISINRKARYDYHYISRGSARMELYIILRTISVMIFGTGAK
ncbi:MAG: sugar transferase [Silicimonas sp.]|nr:sugar transferase [Silicimonas sp.]